MFKNLMNDHEGKKSIQGLFINLIKCNFSNATVYGHLIQKVRKIKRITGCIREIFRRPLRKLFVLSNLKLLGFFA